MNSQFSVVCSLLFGLAVMPFCGQASAQAGAASTAAPAEPAADAPNPVENPGAVPRPTTVDGTNETGPSVVPTTQAVVATGATAPAESASVVASEPKKDPPAAPATGTPAGSPSFPKKCRSDRYSGPPTLLGHGASLGGYGGLTVAYSRFDGDDGVLVGGEGALLFDHRLSIGIAGYGWVSDHEPVVVDDGIARRMEVGYGGVALRYAFLTENLVYASVGALVGGGAVAMVPDFMGREDDVDEDDIDRFFVVEPQVSAHTNVTRWMRVGIQAGYRLTAGITRFGYEDSSMHGPVVGGTAQFGWL